jgi:hypothetical protein
MEETLHDDLLHELHRGEQSNLSGVGGIPIGIGPVRSQIWWGGGLEEGGGSRGGGGGRRGRLTLGGRGEAKARGR